MRLFISSLAVSSVAIAISNNLVSLLLVDIASTFQVNEGIAVQLRTVNAVAEIVLGLLMGFLALRYKHKSLLLTGLLLVAGAAIGSFFAPTLSLMLLFSFIEGSGSIMVTIMIFTLIGDSLPLNKKSMVVGWITAAGFLYSFFGTPLTNSIADVGGWRYIFLLLMLPFSALGVVLVSMGTPFHKSEVQRPALDRGNYLSNIKRVFMNKSAVSCLIGGLFFAGAPVGVFAIAFYRQNFLLPREYAVYIMLGVASVCAVSSLVTGRLGSRFGSKSLTVAGAFGTGVFTLLLFFAPNLWITLAFNFLAAWFIAMANSAYPCLVLEQVPMSRSMLMSFYRIFMSMGGAIGPALGGSLLAIFSSSIETGYRAVGIGLGIMPLVAGCILHFLAKKNQA